MLPLPLTPAQIAQLPTPQLAHETGRALWAAITAPKAAGHAHEAAWQRLKAERSRRGGGC